MTFKCHGCQNAFEADKKVLQCKTGHNFCENCQSSKPECHECKEGFLGTRNLALEEMVKKAHEHNSSGLCEEKAPPKLTLGKVGKFFLRLFLILIKKTN